MTEALKSPPLEILEAQAISFQLALKLKSVETGDHLPRVARIAVNFGRHLHLGQPDLRDLRLGALLHDLGKLGVPDSVLHKPGKLTPKEKAIMQEHPFRGAAVLRALAFPRTVCDVVEQHHECWDGTGYPFSLAGWNISRLARVFAIADAYDAMTSNRSYRVAQSHETARREIFDWSGRQFDPDLVWSFLELTEEQLLAT